METPRPASATVGVSSQPAGFGSPLHFTSAECPSRPSGSLPYSPSHTEPLRAKDAAALSPVGCLHCRVPFLDEGLDSPPEPGYADYLMTKLQPFLKTTSTPTPAVSATGQKALLSGGRQHRMLPRHTS